MYDVLIIGGGIVGTTIARRLSRYKLSVCLVEKSNDVAMGPTKANSAIVHGGYAEANAKLKGRLCYKGRVQYEQLNKELKAQGYLTVAGKCPIQYFKQKFYGFQIPEGERDVG